MGSAVEVEKSSSRDENAVGYSSPALEDGREIFFNHVLNATPEGLTVGQKIELSNFIWGKLNPYFAMFKAMNE